MNTNHLAAVWLAAAAAKSCRGEGAEGRHIMSAAELHAVAEPIWCWRDLAKFMTYFGRAFVPRGRPINAGPTEEPLIVSAEMR